MSAILVDTRIRKADGFERRLMGAALGNDYWSNDDHRFTGRHWWGVEQNGVPEPILDSDADELAQRLGLRGFDGDQTGTDVIIIGADLGTRTELENEEAASREPEETALHLASAVLWHLWPKFRAVAGAEPSMAFSVTLRDQLVDIPDPATVEDLRPFVKSLAEIHSETSERHDLTRPTLHAGDFALHISASKPSAHPAVAPARPFDGPPHHVARMRQAELVIDYFPGELHPDPLFAYGGVYRASPEADQHFADSEPPTHDSWQHEGLPPLPKTVVRRARDFISRRLREAFAPASAPSTGAEAGLGNASRRLSGLVAGVRSTAPDPGNTPPGGGGGGSGGGTGGSVAAALVGSPFIAAFEDSMAIFTRVVVRDPTKLKSVTALVDVVVEGGGRETARPAGAVVPEVIGWATVDAPSDVLAGPTLADPKAGEYLVMAELHDDVVTRFRLKQEDADNA